MPDTLTTTTWSLAFGWGRLALALLVLGAVARVAWLQLRGSTGRGVWIAEGLRGLAALLLAFTLFEPERVSLDTQTRTPVVAVLTDASGSMATRDVALADGRVLTRSEWLEEARAARFWAPLEDRYKVVLESFSPAASNGVAGTDLSAPLEQALAQHPDLRAVLVIGDGDWNTGANPAGAATRLAGRDVPVFAVAAGSARYLPDLELVSVAAPAYGLLDERIAIPVAVQSRLDREVRTTLRVKREGGPEVFSKEIVIPAQALLHEQVALTPTEEGEFTFTVELPVQDGEAIADNNRRSFRMAFRREVLQVLVVESRPRWEFRFLHNALWRDPGTEVKVVLLHPGLSPGEGANYLPRFPATLDELSRFDVVFLGDVGVGPDQLTAEQAGLLRGLVEKQGSGIVFLPGLLGHQATLADSELGDLLPVVLDSRQPKGVGFPLESRLALTTRGAEHLLTLLANSPEENAALWKSLPGFHWHAAVLRAKAGASVLAVHETARGEQGRLPLLVTQTRGNGKALFLGTDSAWRWRRGVEDTYHYRFWGQVVRWMAHQRHLANQEGIRFFYTPESPRPGETVYLHATVFDRTGFPAREGTAQAEIRVGDRVERVELRPESGDWGVYTGSFTPATGGETRIRITAPEAGRELETTLLIEQPTLEKIGRPARLSALRELADITRGQVFSADALAQAVDTLQILPRQQPLERRFRLWAHPVWAALVIGLFIAHWVVRKAIGQV
jgi:hypothetical protein